MKIIPTPIEGLIVFEPKLFHDERGYFFEVHHQQRFAQLGIPTFVQDNHSHSVQHVLRGLHYQSSHAQGKLVGVTQGEVWDVAVDLRRSSPTFGKWFGVNLDAKTHRQMYIPPGFAHGYCVLSATADFYYKCTDFYTPSAEGGLIWNDPQLAIEWPVKQPILSSKDMLYPSFKESVDEKIFA